MADWIPPEVKKKQGGWVPPEVAKAATEPPFPQPPPQGANLPSPASSTGQPASLGGSSGSVPMGTRLDGTPKGSGWLGPIPTRDGQTMTELSFDFDTDGQKVFAPLLVPTLNKEEVDHLAGGGKPTDAIYKKAQDFALQRQAEGKSPFKDEQELPRMVDDMGDGVMLPGTVDQTIPAQPQLGTVPQAELPPGIAPEKTYDEAGDVIITPQQVVTAGEANTQRATLDIYHRAKSERADLDKEFESLASVQDNFIEGTAPWSAHQKRMGEVLDRRAYVAKREEDLRDYAQEEINSVVASTIKKGGDSLYMVRDGVGKVADPAKIQEQVDKVSEELGINDEEFRKNLYNKMLSNVDMAPIAARANEIAKQRVEPLLEKERSRFKEGFKSDAEISARATAQIDSIGSVIQVGNKQEQDAVLAGANEVFSSITAPFKDAEQRYKQVSAQIQQQVNAGLLPYEQGVAMLGQATAEYDSAYDKYRDEWKATSSKLLNESSKIAARYNQKYQQEQRRILDAANKEITTAAEKYAKEFKDDPQLSGRIKAAYESAWSDANKERDKGVSAAEKDRNNRLLTTGGMGSTYGAMLAAADVYFRSAVNGLGGAFKGMSTTLGSDTGYRLGEEMERAYYMPKAKSGEWSDLLDPLNVAALSGQLSGAMAPSMAAAAAAAAGTGGAGAPAAVQIVASALAGWGVETTDIAGRAKDQVLAQGGDLEKANKAWDKSFVSQVQLLPAYSFDGLPFVSGVLRKIPTVAGRVAVGAGTEYVTEMFQEIPQNVAERNILAGKEAWDDFAEGVLDPQNKEVLISMAPIAILGGGGQITSKSAKSILEKSVKDYVTSQKVSEFVESAPAQWTTAMTIQRGEKFAQAVLASMYQSGTITEQQLQQLEQMRLKSMEHIGNARDAGLNQKEASVYAAFANRADELRAKATDGTNPVTQMIAKARLSEVEKSLKEFVLNKEAQYVEVSYADPKRGTTTMSLDQARRMLSDEDFLKQASLLGLTKNGITINGFGAEGAALADEFAGRVATVNDRIAAMSMDPASAPITMAGVRQKVDDAVVSALASESANNAKSTVSLLEETPTGPDNDLIVGAIYEATNPQTWRTDDPVDLDQVDLDVYVLQEKIKRGKYNPGDLARTQFGSRLGTATLGAVEEVIISDPENAFVALNNAISRARGEETSTVSLLEETPTTDERISEQLSAPILEGSQPGASDADASIQFGGGQTTAVSGLDPEAGSQIEQRGPVDDRAAAGVISPTLPADARGGVQQSGEGGEVEVQGPRPVAAAPTDPIQETGVPVQEPVRKKKGVEESDKNDFKEVLSHLLVKPNTGRASLLLGDEKEVSRTEKAFDYTSRGTVKKTYPVDVVVYESKGGKRYVAADGDYIMAAAYVSNDGEITGVITDTGHQNVGIGTNLVKFIKASDPSARASGVVSKQGAKLLDRIAASEAAPEASAPTPELGAPGGPDQGQRLSAASLQEAFGYTPEVAQATEAIADAMGLDKSRISVVKGGTSSPDALFQEEASGWKSRLDQAVTAKGSTMPASQWKAWMDARAKEGQLSLEEAKWTGLSDWLAGKGNEKVTPQQVRDFLKENAVKVEVVEKGLKQGHSGKSWTQEELDELENEARRTRNWTEFEAAQEEYEAQELGTGDTKFGQYQLPGGQNYREVLVTLPKRGTAQVRAELVPGSTRANGKSDFKVFDEAGNWTIQEEALSPDDAIRTAQRFQKADNSGTFRSSHFDEPNILVHLRLNDRTDADGKKVLFIEELQSDWGQQGKKNGFGKGDEFNYWEVVQSNGLGGTRHLNESDANAAAQSIPGATVRYVRDGLGVPSAPFVTSTDAWVELGLKQAIRMAVEGGYDRIAWTTGEQQNERYDLSKQVDRIDWKTNTRTGDKSVMIEAPNGNHHMNVDPKSGIVLSGSIPNSSGKQLDEVVGKDMADKIMSEEAGDLSGDGLKIGGSGMKGFYDKILPTTAKKVSKKLGGDGVVEGIEMNASSSNKTLPQWLAERGYKNIGEIDPALLGRLTREYNDFVEKGTQQSIAITPEMRKKVMEGVPLMQGEKASVEFAQSGEAIIRALQNPDASTGVHELAHIARRFLFDRSIPEENRAGISDADIRTAEEWVGAVDGKWDRVAEEKFARGFERYLRDGRAPNEGLKSVFEKFSQWLRDIYTNLFDSPVKEMVSPAMRKVFDNLLSREGRQPQKKAAAKPAAKPEGERVKKTTVGRAYEGEFRREVKDELEKLGLMREVESHDEAEDQAKAIIEKMGIQTALDAVNRNDIKGGARAFIWEAAVLDLQKQAMAAKDPAEISRLFKEQADLLDEMDAEMLSGGRQASAMQRVLARGDAGFSAERMKAKLKKDFGADPSPELEEALGQIEELKAKIKDAEKRAAEAEAQAMVDAIKDHVTKQKKGGPAVERKRVADRIRSWKIGNKGIAFSSVIPPPVVDAAIEVVALSYQAGEEIAVAIAKGVKYIKGTDWYKKLTGDEQNAAAKALEDYLKTRHNEESDVESGYIRVPKKMIRDAVENGAHDIDTLVAVIKEQLQEEYPDATDREIRDAITDYGKVVNMSSDDISKEIRRLRRVGRDISALEDIQAKKRPLRSGLQRDKMDAEERARKKQIREGLKNLPVDAELQAKEIKTALDAAKTRARNRIEDLQREIDTKQKLPRNTKSVEADAELKALIAEKEALQEQHDAIFEDAAATEQERLDRAIETTRRSIEDYEQRIRDSNLDPQKKAPVKETPELKALRAQRDAAKAEYKKLQEDAGVIERKRDKAQQKAIQKAIDALAQRLRDKDFNDKPKKKERVESTEVIDLKADRLRIQEKFDKEYYKHKLANRTAGELAKDIGWEFWGLGRALNASLDASFVGVQGLMMSVSNLWHNPGATARAFKNSWNAMKSEEKSERWIRKVKAQEWYPKAKEAKLALTEAHAQLSAREESFVSEWTRFIWGMAGAPFFVKSKVDGGKAFDNWMALNPFRATERAAVAFLDTLRIERYLDGVEMLKANKEAGKEVTAKDYKDVADVVNTLTGRASLGKAEAMADTLTKLIYSPRLWSSQIKTFTPYGLYWLSKKSPTAQKMAVQDWSRFVGTTLGLVAMAAVYLNDDDDEDTKVELDPRSSEYLKIKLGKNIVVDPWGGRLSHVIYTTRALAGAASLVSDKPYNAFKNRKGDILPLGIDHRSPTLLDLTLEVGFNKAAPPLSFLIDAARTTTDMKGNRKTAFGKEYHMDEAALERITPMIGNTVADLMKEEPNAMGVILSATAFFGPVQTYDEDKHPKSKYEQEASDIRSESIQQTKDMTDIIELYEAGTLTKEQADSTFKESFKDLPVEKRKSLVSSYKERLRYVDAPPRVKEILDIENTLVRARMVKDLRETMTEAQKRVFLQELHDAKVITDKFKEEYRALK